MIARFVPTLCVTLLAQNLSAAPKYDAGLADINTPRIPQIYDASIEERIIKRGNSAFSAVDPSETSRAEQVMNALQLAYPRRVGPVVFRDGDWAVPLRGQWFFYAEGRLLPEAWRSQSGEYSPQPFYPYPKTLPPWKRPSKDEAARLAQAAKTRRNENTAKRSPLFFDTLWNITSKAEAWEQVKSIRFLGKSILVHHGIMEELALVEQRINAEAKHNGEVRSWLQGIASITAWNWRDIADVKSRSNHAYGIAVDLLPAPKVYRSMDTYWRSGRFMIRCVLDIAPKFLS